MYFQNSCKISGNISETEICKWENNNKFKLRKLYKKYHKYQFITLRGLISFSDKSCNEVYEKKDRIIIRKWNSTIKKDFEILFIFSLGLLIELVTS